MVFSPSFDPDLNILPTNFTMTPNYFVDDVIRFLSPPDQSVLNVIIRKTIGWQKSHDIISLSQLMFYTGMSKNTVIKSVESLIVKKLITKKVQGINGQQTTTYGLGVFKKSDLEEFQKNSNKVYLFKSCTAPPCSNFEQTKETKEINKKEPTSLPPSSVVGSHAVVKAPAQRTLPPDPVAKTVASALKPSQSDVCSKSAPPAGDAKSVADAPCGELLFLLEKYKKETSNVDVDKNLFKKAYDEMKSRSDVKSPFGLLKFIFEGLKKKSEASKVKDSLALKHRWLAEHCCGEGTGGSRFIEGNFYVKQSGSFTTKYEFGVEDNIWHELEEIVKKKGIKAD